MDKKKVDTTNLVSLLKAVHSGENISPHFSPLVRDTSFHVLKKLGASFIKARRVLQASDIQVNGQYTERFSYLHDDPRSYEIVPSFNEEEVKILQYRVVRVMQKMGKFFGEQGVMPTFTDVDGRLRTAGNFAVRDQESGTFAITGTEVDKINLAPENIVIVKKIQPEKRIMQTGGTQIPSREVLIANALFQEYPDINFFAHFHNDEMLKIPEIPTTAEVSWAATEHDAVEVFDLLKTQGGIIINLREHGQVLVANSFEQLVSKYKVLQDKVQ